MMSVVLPDYLLEVKPEVVEASERVMVDWAY